MIFDIITLGAAQRYTKQYVDKAIIGLGKGLKFKGAVDYYKDLPENPELGDLYTVKYKGESGQEISGMEYAWGEVYGTLEWIPIGPDIDAFVQDVKERLEAIENNMITGINGVTVTKAAGVVTVTEVPVDLLTTPNGLILKCGDSTTN